MKSSGKFAKLRICLLFLSLTQSGCGIEKGETVSSVTDSSTEESGDEVFLEETGTFDESAETLLETDMGEEESLKKDEPLFRDEEQIFCGRWELKYMIQRQHLSIMPEEEIFNINQGYEEQVGKIITVRPASDENREELEARISNTTLLVIPIFDRGEEQLCSGNAHVADLGLTEGEYYIYLEVTGNAYCECYPIDINHMVIMLSGAFYYCERVGDWPYTEDESDPDSNEMVYYYLNPQLDDFRTLLDGKWRVERLMQDDIQRGGMGREIEMAGFPLKVEKRTAVIPIISDGADQRLYGDITIEQLGLKGEYFTLIEYFIEGKLQYSAIPVTKYEMIWYQDGAYYLCSRVTELEEKNEWSISSLLP